MKITLNVDKDSLQRVLDSMNGLNSDVEVTSLQYLKEFESLVAAESYRRVPKDTGALAGSYYSLIRSAGSTYRLTLGYGGPNDKINPVKHVLASSYAWFVHENLFAYHYEGEAKFLENAVEAVQNLMDFEQEIETVLRKYRW